MRGPRTKKFSRLEEQFAVTRVGTAAWSFDPVITRSLFITKEFSNEGLSGCPLLDFGHFNISQCNGSETNDKLS
jgi:hypothetical protein